MKSRMLATVAAAALPLLLTAPGVAQASPRTDAYCQQFDAAMARYRQTDDPAELECARVALRELKAQIATEAREKVYGPTGGDD